MGLDFNSVLQWNLMRGQFCFSFPPPAQISISDSSFYITILPSIKPEDRTEESHAISCMLDAHWPRSQWPFLAPVVIGTMKVGDPVGLLGCRGISESRREGSFWKRWYDTVGDMEMKNMTRYWVKWCIYSKALRQINCGFFVSWHEDGQTMDSNSCRAVP